MSDAAAGPASVRQQIIEILDQNNSTPAQQADEILALVAANEAPDGWFHFGSLVDWDGELEFSKELDEDGLPQWERPLPLRGEGLVEDWTPSGHGWRELNEGEKAGGREFVVHGWLSRPIDSFHKMRTWVQDASRPTKWSKEMEALGYPSFDTVSTED